ncbi:response regulator transcription factor [Agrobacterium sp. DE0009]|uniref:response regulator transcription factor n=1 Tax=Agrobacterium sp. DE0009 TaxID=2587505 RepID=UPI0011AB08FF|nr:response regulator [Agrobacterium sp. DE0009]
MEDNEEFEKAPAMSRVTMVIADPFVEKTESLVSSLIERGFLVVRSSTLSEAMAACLAVQPTIVLTELRFPDGTGLELVKWISQWLPSTRIVIHSWFADIPIAVVAVKAGADDFVPKPTDDEFLTSILLYGSANVPSDCRIEEPDRVRHEHIEEVLRRTSSNVSLAARHLNLHRRSLQRMLKRYQPSA